MQNVANELIVSLILITALVLSCLFSSYIPFLPVLALFVTTAIFYGLWNGTIPGIFGLRRITFWESLRLLLIAWLLLGGAFAPFAWR